MHRIADCEGMSRGKTRGNLVPYDSHELIIGASGAKALSVSSVTARLKPCPPVSHSAEYDWIYTQGFASKNAGWKPALPAFSGRRSGVAVDEKTFKTR